MTTPELAADCSQCFALCCVVLPFSAVSGFGVDKPGGTPCLNLADDDRCSIHSTLRADGWPGCTVFECFGAGQQVSQVTYEGVSWRERDNLAEMGAVLSVMRQLHEMLLHLGEVARRSPDPAAATVESDIVAFTAEGPDALLALDLDDLHRRVGTLLEVASTRLRSAWSDSADLSRRDLAGADLRGHDLRGARLRGALLIKADLRACDLTDAELLGADLRDGDVRGADLSRALFLSQAQTNAMRGDSATRLPDRINRPPYWPAAGADQ